MTATQSDTPIPPSDGAREDAMRLAEALRPFAALLQEHHDNLPDARPIYCINDVQVTAGDLRRARGALLAHDAPAQAVAQAATAARDREVWRAALTLANNLCVQESDRENDADGDHGWINGTNECARRIRDYIAPGESELIEMLAEAGVPPAPVGAVRSEVTRDLVWSAYNQCPSDLSTPDRMQWMARHIDAVLAGPAAARDVQAAGRMADAAMDALFPHGDWRRLPPDFYASFERKPQELRNSLLHALVRAGAEREAPAVGEPKRGRGPKKP